MFGRKRKEDTLFEDITISESNNSDLYDAYGHNITPPSSAFCFRGSCNFASEQRFPDPKNGDVVIDLSTNTLLVYYDGKFNPLKDGDIDTTNPKFEEKHKKIISKVKCNSCGAPLKQIDNTHYFCEYCGSMYEYK